MFKNVASQKLIVFAFDTTTNLPKTGDAANITAYVSKDYGTVTVLGDTSATEMDATNAKGYYLFDLTQAETNADTLLFSAKSTTSNIVVIGAPSTVMTNPANFTAFSLDSSGRVDAIKINSVSAASITTINANIGTTQPTNFTSTGANALVKSDMVDIAGAAVSTTSAQIGVNAVQVGATVQTGRDIGASVLISSGTGTGQLDVTAGVIKANLAQILGTVLTETAGQLAGGFKKFFNIGTPASTMDALTLVATATNLTNAPTAGDLTATMKTSVTTAATAATPTVLLTPGTSTGQVTLAAGILTSNTNGDFTATQKTSLNAATPASVTGAVGSVTGNVGGNVVGSVGSVTGNVGGNVTGSTGSIAGITFPTNFSALGIGATGHITNVDTLTTYTGNTPQTGDSFTRLGAPAGASHAADIAAVNAKTTNLPAAPASTTNITAGTITTVTNLTNAPTAGDLTATMKTSITTAATAATPTAAAVSGDVQGNVLGSVSGTVGGVVGLNTSLIDTTISSRLADSSYVAPANSTIAAINTKLGTPAGASVSADILAVKTVTDVFTFTGSDVNANITAVNDIPVDGSGTSIDPWGPA